MCRRERERASESSPVWLCFVCGSLNSYDYVLCNMISCVHRKPDLQCDTEWKHDYPTIHMTFYTTAHSHLRMRQGSLVVPDHHEQKKNGMFEWNVCLSIYTHAYVCQNLQLEGWVIFININIYIMAHDSINEWYYANKAEWIPIPTRKTMKVYSAIQLLSITVKRVVEWNPDFTLVMEQFIRVKVWNDSPKGLFSRASRQKFVSWFRSSSGLWLPLLH